MASNPVIDVGAGRLYLGRAIDATPGLLTVTTGDIARATWPYTKVPHALLMAATGGGKTTELRVMAWNLITSPHADAGVALLADGIPDADSFVLFEGQPRIAAIASGTDETTDLIEGGHETYRKRLEALGHARRQAKATRLRPTYIPPAPLFVDIDEYLLYILDVAPAKRARVINMLREIGLNGRKVDVHLLLALQRAAVKDAEAGLPGALKASLKLRVATTGEAGMDSVEARIVFDDDSAAKRVPTIEGGALARVGGIEVAYRVPWLPDVTDPMHTERMTDDEIADWWAMFPDASERAA